MSDPLSNFFHGLGEQTAIEGAKLFREGCERDYEAGGITKIVEDEWEEGWKRDYESDGISSLSTTRRKRYA